MYVMHVLQTCMYHVCNLLKNMFCMYDMQSMYVYMYVLYVMYVMYVMHLCMYVCMDVMFCQDCINELFFFCALGKYAVYVMYVCCVYMSCMYLYMLCI